jgi:hypothetical protein
VSRHRPQDEVEVVFDDHDDASHLQPDNADPSQTELVPYAHRDLKPGYDAKIPTYPVINHSHSFLQKRDASRRWIPNPDGFWKHSEGQNQN